MKNKTAVVIQGPPVYVKELRQFWQSDRVDIIWSGWEGDEDKYEPTDNVIYSPIPQGYLGVNRVLLQKTTSYEGLRYAKSLGYTRAIKCRSDIYPTQVEKLLDLFDQNKTFNFIYWYHAIKWQSFCFVDYLFEGDIDAMIYAWEYDSVNGNYAEALLTKQILSKYGEDDIAFFGDKITESNELYWIGKEGRLISSYAPDPNYRTNMK